MFLIYSLHFWLLFGRHWWRCVHWKCSGCSHPTFSVPICDKYSTQGSWSLCFNAFYIPTPLWICACSLGPKKVWDSLRQYLIPAAANGQPAFHFLPQWAHWCYFAHGVALRGSSVTPCALVTAVLVANPNPGHLSIIGHFLMLSWGATQRGHIIIQTNGSNLIIIVTFFCARILHRLCTRKSFSRLYWFSNKPVCWF